MSSILFNGIASFALAAWGVNNFKAYVHAPLKTKDVQNLHTVINFARGYLLNKNKPEYSSMSERDIIVRLKNSVSELNERTNNVAPRLVDLETQLGETVHTMSMEQVPERVRKSLFGGSIIGSMLSYHSSVKVPSYLVLGTLAELGALHFAKNLVDAFSR